MAAIGKAVKFIKKGAAPEDKKKGKAGYFLDGLKDWITSPGGIITLVLIVGTVWYIHHNYEAKKG